MSPCDQTTFCTRLYVGAGRPHELPPLNDLIDDEESNQEYILDLNVRKTQRLRYPGACSLVYQHLIQIVLETLLGWDPKSQSGQKGVLGTLEAWARADEEQGRKSLYSHWQLWVKGLNNYRRDIQHQDEETKAKARKTYFEYVDNVMTASYGDEFMISDNCSGCTNNDTHQGMEVDSATESHVDDNFKQCDLQILRNARHKDCSLDINGKVLQCRKCNKQVSTVDIVKLAVDR